jgi:two-component system, NtrC family, response regulator HydG
MSKNGNVVLPIILVDDEPDILFSASLILEKSGYDKLHTIQDSRELMPLLEDLEGNVAAILLDLSMPHISGDQLLPKIKERFPKIPVIIITAIGELEVATQCMRSGALDYLVKPVEEEIFISSIKRAVEMSFLRRQVDTLKDCLLSGKLNHPEFFSTIITQDSQMHGIFQYMEAIAASQEPVLVEGETGVGKESMVEAIHRLSGREGPLVPINVAGLDTTMFADTLFGHRKGAFTGAQDNRKGLVASAAGGTLFLDEIGDLAESSQIKLLRLIQERRYRALGSDIAMYSDVRIICATNQNMKERMGAGKFRADLFYRLSAHRIQIPPLKKRPGDIPSLVDYFLKEAASSLGKKIPTPPPELFSLLSTYAFPGNVRELRALVHDAVAQHQSGVLSMATFREVLQETAQIDELTVNSGAPLAILDRFPTLREGEAFLIAEAMERADNNQGIAASLLGISRSALNKRLARRNS